MHRPIVRSHYLTDICKRPFDRTVTDILIEPLKTMPRFTSRYACARLYEHQDSADAR